MSDKQAELLKEHFMKSGVAAKPVGEGLKGYPVRTEKALLYGTKLKSFYFYLVLDNSLDMSVIGDDFISCCAFECRFGGKIVINAMDMNLYLSSHGADYVDVSEVLNIALD